MPLTDTKIRTEKPADKPLKLRDGGGLYLLIPPTGGKWWRLDYRFDGKRKTLSMGVYPDIGLKDARERRDEARKLLANGTDPGAVRKAQKAAKEERAANSFEVIARLWYENKAPSWSESTRKNALRILEKDVFPWLGGRPVADIDPPDVLEVCRRIESRG
ncbi:MAG: integrase arm-type DNA-binding domain-containing protein, partial [Zoogloeaceae bacterium]|nr:integrase arm-type DNA-binding domain-containing protein [Zoogloeaceae bacterium]